MRLLASGVCDLVSAMPLLASDLGAPARPSARVPDHPGAPRKRERPFVPLVPLAASRAYLGSALGLVLQTPARPVTSLAALRDDPPLRLGVVAGTLSGTLAMAWRHGALRSQLVSLGQRENLLDGLGAVVAMKPRCCRCRNGTAGARTTRRHRWPWPPGAGPSA